MQILLLHCSCLVQVCLQSFQFLNIFSGLDCPLDLYLDIYSCNFFLIYPILKLLITVAYFFSLKPILEWLKTVPIIQHDFKLLMYPQSQKLSTLVFVFASISICSSLKDYVYFFLCIYTTYLKNKNKILVCFWAVKAFNITNFEKP